MAVRAPAASCASRRQFPRLGLRALRFITRQIGVVEYIADDVAVMQAGRIVKQGPGEADVVRAYDPKSSLCEPSRASRKMSASALR